MVERIEKITGAAVGGRGAESGVRKLAVLGGGMGSLSAVYELTNDEHWKDRYDITVYQTGWRLGGKGASGRNMEAGYGSRIEEHGVHVLFGFYTNTFRLMEDCYGKLARPPGSLLATWRDAFKAMNHVVLPERLPDGTWDLWAYNPPPANGLPTHDLSTITIGRVIETVGRWFYQLIRDFYLEMNAASLTDSDAELRAALRSSQSSIETLASVGVIVPERTAQFRADVAQLDGEPLLGETELEEFILARIVAAFGRALDMYWAGASSPISNPRTPLEKLVRKTWILGNFMYANLRGVEQSRLVRKPFDTVDHVDYRAWLDGYAKKDAGATCGSVLLRWVYDAVFGYAGGDMRKPDLEAGTTLQILVRVLMTYGEAFLYKMQAGMGDVVFGPLYLVLRARGVKFEFFHRVTELEVAQENGRSVVSRIHIERQASVRAGTYDPLVRITDSEGRELDCWPSAPLYGQLENGDGLKAMLFDDERDLEAYLPSPHAQDLVLDRTCFDQVILGIGLGAARVVCKQLIAGDARWRMMDAKVGTVATMGVQFWLRSDLASVAEGHLEEPAMFCGYDYDLRPLDTYADMTQVLARESWAAEGALHEKDRPRSIAYFCSPLGDDADVEGSAAMRRVRGLARTLLADHMSLIWPDAITTAGEFNWALLVDPTGRTGDPRLDAQYFVGVANPSDRYTLTLAGSSCHRLWPDDTGYANLVVSGDWVQTTFNIGSIESTVVSGMQAANVVRGIQVGHGIAGWGRFSTLREV